MTKPTKAPFTFLVRRKRKNSLGPTESWLLLFIYVTATNDKAHHGLLDANLVSNRAGLQANQNCLISPRSDQRNNFQSICPMPVPQPFCFDQGVVLRVILPRLDSINNQQYSKKHV